MTEHYSKFIDMSAAADFFGPGSLEVPRYESEILDLVRRRGVLGQRIQKVPATGQPSRYLGCDNHPTENLRYAFSHCATSDNVHCVHLWPHTTAAMMTSSSFSG